MRPFLVIAGLVGTWAVASVTLSLGAQEPGAPTSAHLLEEAITLVDTRNDCAGAVPTFERVAASSDRVLAARALVQLGTCYERLGDEKARQTYRRVLEQYAEQRGAVLQARARLAALDRRTSIDRSLVLRRLWNDRPAGDLDWAGPPSPDGRLMPWFDDQRRLVVMDITLSHRGPPAPLGQASDGLPKCTIWTDVLLAPGGREAAFVCEQQGASELRVARLNGGTSTQRRVADGGLRLLAWVGSDAVLAQGHGAGADQALLLIALRDGRRRVLAALSAPTNAAVAPDRHAVAYDAPQEGGAPTRDVQVVSLNGGPATRIGWPESDEQIPGWTPDGRGVVFVSDRTGSPGLWLQRFDGASPIGTPRLLTQDLGRISGAWGLTTNGSFLYLRQTGLVDVYVADLDEHGLVSGAPRPASRTIGAHMWSAWSPDGRALATGSAPPSARIQGVTVLELATRSERPIPAWLGLVQHLRWSPDGRRLALRGRDRSGRYGFYALDVQTGTVEALYTVDDESSLGACAWDAGGTGLLFHQNGRLFRHDLATRATTPVPFKDDVTMALPFDVLRPGGTLAFLRTGPGGTVALTTATPDGTLTELLKPEADERIGPPAWLPGGDALIITRTKTGRSLPDDARRPSLWRLDVATRHLTPLGLAMDGLRDVWVGPDGRHLSFTAGSPTFEPWVVEHFLPTAQTRQDH